jgi:hypothetical protein
VSGLLGGKLMIRENDVFYDYTEGSGLEDITNQLCPVFFDLDGDFDDDLFLAGNHEVNTGRMFRNNGDTTFTDISSNNNQGIFELGQSVAIGDIDNDGDFDFYLGSGFGFNSMWRNDGTGFFTNITGWSNTGYDGYTRGICFADFDNDTDLDIFVNRATDYNLLLENDGTGIFTDISNQANVDDVFNGYAASIGDLNNDGMIDIVATNCDDHPTCVYINQTVNENNFLRVRLIGQHKNSLALGAILKLYAITEEPSDTVLIGTRQISSHSGLHSVSELTAHFGTGEYQLLRLEVTFASHERVVIPQLNPGQTITIAEPQVGIDDQPELPENTLLVNAYPNPFNNSTKIVISGGTENYLIKIYNILGREIKSLSITNNQNASTFIWDGTDKQSQSVKSGVYFLKVNSGEYKASYKLTLLK